MALALRRINKLNLVVRGVSARYLSDHEKEGISKIREMAFKWQGFNQYGLLRDDIRNELDPDVAEAVRRLPKKVKMERDFRGLRATQASIQNTVLPEELWTKPSEDHNYLEPYVAEVIREREEIDDWEKTH